jgi:RimJ/RimL family protein N-acetyltransferase
MAQDDKPQPAAPNPPPLTITGERIGLGPLASDLAESLQRWFNDFVTGRTQGELPEPHTLDRVTARLGRLAAGSPNRICFSIVKLETGIAIGWTWLTPIDYRHGTAEFGIMIGEASARGRGYGTETTRLMLDYALGTLGLRNVLLEVYGNNSAGLRAYEKAGFRVIGRRHESFRTGTLVYDRILMEAAAPG